MMSCHGMSSLRFVSSFLEVEALDKKIMLRKREGMSTLSDMQYHENAHTFFEHIMPILSTVNPFMKCVKCMAE